MLLCWLSIELLCVSGAQATFTNSVAGSGGEFVFDDIDVVEGEAGFVKCMGTYGVTVTASLPVMTLLSTWDAGISHRK